MNAEDNRFAVYVSRGERVRRLWGVYPDVKSATTVAAKLCMLGIAADVVDLNTLQSEGAPG